MIGVQQQDTELGRAELQREREQRSRTAGHRGRPVAGPTGDDLGVRIGEVGDDHRFATRQGIDAWARTEAELQILQPGGDQRWRAHPRPANVAHV